MPIAIHDTVVEEVVDRTICATKPVVVIAVADTTTDVDVDVGGDPAIPTTTVGAAVNADPCRKLPANGTATLASFPPLDVSVTVPDARTGEVTGETHALPDQRSNRPPRESSETSWPTAADKG